MNTKNKVKKTPIRTAIIYGLASSVLGAIYIYILCAVGGIASQQIENIDMWQFVIEVGYFFILGFNLGYLVHIAKTRIAVASIIVSLLLGFISELFVSPLYYSIINDRIKDDYTMNIFWYNIVFNKIMPIMPFIIMNLGYLLCILLTNNRNWGQAETIDRL